MQIPSDPGRQADAFAVVLAAGPARNDPESVVDDGRSGGGGGRRGVPAAEPLARRHGAQLDVEHHVRGQRLVAAAHAHQEVVRGRQRGRRLHHGRVAAAAQLGHDPLRRQPAQLPQPPPHGLGIHGPHQVLHRPHEDARQRYAERDIILHLINNFR